MSQPEAWLLGRVEGVSDALMPAAHSLVQARRELVILQDDLIRTEYLASPGGAASIGFHIAHINGSLDRLFSYARGCLLYTSPSPRDQRGSRMPSSA